MTDPSTQSTIGLKMNDHIWDGSQWVHQPELAQLPAEHPAAHPTLGPWSASFPVRPELPDPHTYALLQQIADDVRFNTRVVKVLIVLWLTKAVVAMLAIIALFVLWAGMMNALGQAIGHAVR